jgi:pimeloyl-ACP methyl ester carboxylesterase
MPRRLIFTIGVCFLVPTCLRADQPQPKKPVFDSGGVSIHYVVEGKEDGEPVLLIHGFTANIENQWTPVIKELTPDYKVIALDCRGHGASGKPHDPKQYGLEMVKDPIRLLDHLKIQKAHVVGYSMGASIALQIAVRYPERVRTLTLGGAGLPRPGRERMLLNLAESLEKGNGLGPLILALNPKDRPEPTKEQIKQIDAILLARNDPKALAAVSRGSTNKDLVPSEDQIKGIRMPVLALIGEVDPLRAGVDELKKRLPDMKVVVIDKADHINAFNRPEFVDGLKEFLDAHRTTKTSNRESDYEEIKRKLPNDTLRVRSARAGLCRHSICSLFGL